MVKKRILICLIGLIGVVCLASPAWAHSLSDRALWLAQIEKAPQTVPSEQPGEKSQNNLTIPSAADQTKPKQTTTPNQQSRSVQNRSQDKPFNPYDMKALKQFDAGDHRSK